MSDSRAIAIIGMSCSFPGSPDVESFWQSIHEGRIHFREVPPDRWDHSLFYNNNPRETDMTYARKVAYLDDLRSFAPERYGMPPRRAYPMDPQQRLMLDHARLALDDAGYGGRPLPKSTGVYIGASVSEYKDLVVTRLRARQLLQGQWGSAPELPETAAKAAVRDVAAIQQYSMVGVLLNMIACGVSEAFDLQGPALVMDAACSSALLAVHEAMLHLRERICDAAIVGGVYSICTPDMMVGFSRIGALSRSDACRPFDNKADGFVLGEGAGVVVLKRLEDAQRDGDRIWAVVRGAGLNNDGRGEGPMTPRLSGQVDALARAYRDAGLSPHTVGYIEAHGTATPVGDATEISAIKENAKAHGQGPISCGITSVKGNIGHTLAASGMAGLIKTVMVLNRGIIPPQAGLQTPSERLGLEGSGFYVPAQPRPFERTAGSPRRAAVNAFGFGGTNVHVILEEPPQPVPQRATVAVQEMPSAQLFVISAAKPALLVQHLTELGEAVERSTAPLRDIAYTLTVTRRQEDARVAFVAHSRKDFSDKLQLARAVIQGETSDEVAYSPKPGPHGQRQVAFLFPGQDVRALEFCSYACRQFPGFQPRFKALAAGCNGWLDKFMVSSLSTPESPGHEAHWPEATGDESPELVLAAATQLAVTEFLAEMGLRPQAAIGHGYGEFVAAAAGGVLEPEAAFQLVAAGSGAGSQHLPSNGSGNGVSSLRVSSSRIPVISSITSAPYPAESGEIRRILAQRCAPNGHLEAALRALRGTGANVFLQIGGGDELLETARSTLNGDNGHSVHILSLVVPHRNADAGFLQTLGRLAILGFPLEFSALYHDARTVSLPSAPLSARSFWVVERKQDSFEARTQAAPAAASPRLAEDSHSKSGIVERDEVAPGSGGEPASRPDVKIAPRRFTPASAATDDEIRARILELIAKVSAYALEDLKLESRLGDDLGFDSLMGMDLYVGLIEAFPEASDLPESMIGGETTIEQLVQSVASAISQPRKGETQEASAEICRYAVTAIDRPQSSPPAHSELPFPGRILLVADSGGVAAALKTRFEQAGREVAVVSPTHVLKADGQTAVIDLLGLASATEAMHVSGLRTPVLGLLRRAAEAGSGEAPSAFVVAHCGIAGAGLAGAAKAIAREWPKTLVKSIEAPSDAPPSVIAETIFAELSGTDQSVEVSYATGRRQVPALTRAPIAAHPLRDSAVVAISGGGKGLGAKLAIELARRHHARSLLLGRSDDAAATVQSVREAGGDALYISCDVRDPSQVEAAFRQCRETFGPIEHVIHAAGVLADQSITTKDLDRAAAVFDTKVAGALALWQAAQPDPVKSFLMYGSWAGRFGSAHQTDYSAANHALGRLAETLGSRRPETRVVAIDLPPWEGSGMVSAMPEAARKKLSRRVRFLTDETGLAHIAAELGADGPSGEVILGAALEEVPIADRAVVRLSTSDYPWLEDHKIEGKIVVPLAFTLDQAAAAARRSGLGPALAISEIEIVGMPTVPDVGTTLLSISTRGSGGSVEIQAEMGADAARPATVRLRAASVSSPLPLLVPPENGQKPDLSLAEFYQHRVFHGPRLQALKSVLEVGPAHAIALIGDGGDGEDGAAAPVPGIAFDILALDATLQLCAYWASMHLGRIGLPVGADEIRILDMPRAGTAGRIVGILEGSSGGVLSANVDLLDAQGAPLLQVRGLRCRLMGQATSLQPAPARQSSVPLQDIDPGKWHIEEFPEIKALRQRIEMAQASGLADPYFSVHEEVTKDTSIIGGQEYVNFASYNYLGLSGDANVTAAAVAALQKYGTSVSASRLASGEKPLHRELEREIADFLGCEDSIVMVSGHATNVSVIGHLFGPQDLVVHDSLAHDSILGGIRLSGAKRLPFPHNDVDALDQVLRQSRGNARRVLIAVEGVYSMDGDVPPLREIVEIKRRHRALLLVDEAHSLGVLGDSGRGIGEHCGIRREDVEMWMGTLSKSLASCGGYIAGSAELVRYLKYSNPGFVYSVGISPANAAAALAALHELKAHPELVATLRDRSRLFLDLSRRHGINTGLSEGTSVVPCIVGSSLDCLKLSCALGERHINVQPILYPAVEENLTRLRFFLTARHSEEQIRTTVCAVAEELEKINPYSLTHRSSGAGEASQQPRKASNAAVS